MPKDHPVVPLAKWYSFPADSLTRAFLNPCLPWLWVQAEPEHLDIVTRVVNYITSGESSWDLPKEEPICYALRIRSQSIGYWELREGTLVNFDNRTFARLTNLGRPYWRYLTAPSFSDDPILTTGNYLLSYIGLEFLDLAELNEHEREHAHLLTPMSTLLD
ncbi:hypothetical protein GCM10022408_38010 [Hymenobacter fastidiosus]|uniref:Uncharacterized protein n=1 Tax=Hymenobacter fastidiosus TaxID=486264 RepID=A0ABP7T3H5_9BACT